MLEDGAAHQVDSSELAFRLAAQGAFKEAFPKGRPVVLEPVMKVDIVAPLEFQGSVIGGINQRKGTIADTEIRDEEFTLTAEVSLNDMFGCSSSFLPSSRSSLTFTPSSDASQLRGMTQGSCFLILLADRSLTRDTNRQRRIHHGVPASLACASQYSEGDDGGSPILHFEEVESAPSNDEGRGS